jgi:hypothetical protein
MRRYAQETLVLLITELRDERDPLATFGRLTDGLGDIPGVLIR